MNGSIRAAIGGAGSVKFSSSPNNYTAGYSHAHNHLMQSNGDLMPAAYHSLGHNHGPSASAASAVAGGQANSEQQQPHQQQQPQQQQLQQQSQEVAGHHHHHIHHEHYPNPAHFVLTSTAASGSFSASSAVTPGTANSEPAPYYVRQPPLPPPVPSLPPQYHPYHNHLPLERVESQKSLFQGNVANGGHSHQLPPTASAEPTLKNPKKSSLKKRSKFDVITRSTQSLTNLVATSGSAAQQSGTKSPMGLMPSLTRKQSSGSAKHVEIVHFAIKGGPPWGFRIKQRNDNVFISKVNCGGRGHKGGLRVHDEIIAVNNFELDNHPLTLHRDPASKENVDFDHLTKLDFTYQLIKHTLNRQLFLSVRRWNSDWELAPHIFYPLSTPGDDGEGPHHQSEEELLSPNEDFGPEARSAHRKLLIGYQQHPQSPESQFFFFNGGPLQTPSSVEHLPEHFHQHLEESSAEAQQFLIPPPSNLGFSGSSTDGDNDQVTVQLANGESSCEHDQRGESPLYSTSSTTTTGCLIAAAEAEINQAAQEVITPSPSISNSTTVTTTSPTPTSNASEQSTTTEQYSSEQYSYPTISMATATLTSAVLGGASPIPGPFLLPGDEYYLQQMYSAGTAQTVPTFSTGQHSTSILLGNTAEQAVPSEYRRKDGSAQRSSRKGGGGGGGHRHRRKGAINLLESGSDQASDIAPLDLSPDGGSTEDVSTGTPSTRSALSSDSEISRSDLSDDSDEETDRGTIRRRVVVDKNNNSNSGSNEKMQQQMAAQPSSNSLDRNVGPNFKLKTAKNIWSPSSSSLASPGSPPNAALLNSTENSDLYSDQISVNTQVPTHSTGEEGACAGHLLSLHFVSSPSNDPQFAHLHHHNHNHYPQHYQHQHQQYSQQLPPQFAQAPLSLADYQAAQQQQGLGHRQQQHHHHPQLNHHSSEVVPPPYSSATYEQFEQKQQAEQQQQQQRHLQQYLAQHPTEPPALFSSSTLPRSMTIMESGGGGAESALHSSVPHVAEVYQPRQHPTHKYWTLPRSIATGIPLPNGGPYIERPGGVPPGMVLSEADDVPISAMAAMDDVDRFNKHHEQLQQTRIKEIAEQHMKPIHSTTTTTTSGTTVQEEIAHGTQTVSTSTTSKHIIQHVVARDEPPHGATLLYETEDATFYTVPAPEGEDELDQGMQATSSTTVKTTTYAVPKKKLDEGIGPVNESGVPITPKAGVKSEHGSEWYKAWVRNMHKMERAGRDDSADSICVKVKSPRYKGTDYQLTVEGKRGPPKYVPGNIADYVPGHSSISEREKQIKNGPELSGQPGTSSQLVAKAPTTTTSYYHEKCVFNTLTGQKQAPASVGSGSGYDSDSSYIIKKSKPKQSTTKPASPAVYRAVQRGEIDIPLGGLQRPAPPKQQPRRVQRTSSAAVYQPSQLNEGKINVQYRMPTNKLVAVDPMLDITAGSFTSTATGKNSGRYSYSGFMSPASMASTTVADSSFSTVVKQPTPTPRNVVLTSSLGKGPCGSEPYSMARHHYMPTAMSPVALDRYERAFADKENEPKKMARVIYDFHAQSRNELAVKKGDLVIVRKTVSLNWVEVEDSASGLVGLVPRSYLDFEQYGVARARYDFAAKTSVEISFKRGEKLTLLRRVDNNWYEGMNEKQDVGIFPVSYVEAIKQPIVLKSLEQRSACSPDSNAPHIHFSTDASREPGGGTTSQASSASSASLASIISIDNNRFGKADSYEHQYHHQHQHQQHQQHQQQLHSHPLHSTMMMTPSSMSPSPSGSMSISLGSLPQQYQSSSLSSVSSRPLPTPLCSHPPLSPVTANVPYHYSQQAQKEHEAALQKQAIYFSSTSSEPATYHHIRRAPEAIRHFGGCGERTCLPKAQIYRVIHPYKPQQIDEIELTYGDLLTVTTLCDDGWYLGRSTLSGKFGTFPGNYVEQV